MKRKSRTRDNAKFEDTVHLTMVIAVLVGAAMIQYTEFVFFSARDANGHTADIPMWRVHMGSACLGTIAFMIVLFCCDTLGHKSKRRALRLAIPWLPLVGLTGLASIIHIPILIVIILGLTYGAWVFFRSRGKGDLSDV
jgi:hypothetical protein